jgi:hypothetical protein
MLRRVAVLFWLLALASLVFVWQKHAAGYAAAAEGNEPFFNDFTPTYGAALLLAVAPPGALYAARPMRDAGHAAAQAQYGVLSERQAAAVGYSPWFYPPSFNLILRPLAALPYLPAYLLWSLGTLALYSLALFHVLPRPDARWLAVPLALAAPASFFNLMFGQTGFLIAGLLGLGLALLPSRPWLAGLLVGLASVKPNLGLLVPFALVAGGQWRALAGAALSALGLGLLSLAIDGPQAWLSFLYASRDYFTGFELQAYNLRQMTSVLSAWLMGGGSLAGAALLQKSFAAAAALLVVAVWLRGWRRPDTLGLQAAILCLATTLALPSIYLYDLPLLTVAAAFLWRDLRGSPTSRLEWTAWAGGLFGLAIVFPLAKWAGWQLGPLFPAILLGLALSRYRRALAA